MTQHIIVCGGRDYHLTDVDKDDLRTLLSWLGNDYVLCHGDARGADKEAAAAMAGVAKIKAFPVDHAKHGPWPQAGPRRNREMLLYAEGQCRRVCVLAFPGGNGTHDMCKQARDRGHLVVRMGNHAVARTV